jgi:hypothetical protein
MYRKVLLHVSMFTIHRTVRRDILLTYSMELSPS